MAVALAVKFLTGSKISKLFYGCFSLAFSAMEEIGAQMEGERLKHLRRNFSTTPLTFLSLKAMELTQPASDENKRCREEANET
ncbi:MAG: hypothetical protein K9K75_01210 [Deltaproteobacteria bacterium]|nr:hypothetical protein [Deltaproteobacteria bacterium]